MTEHRKFTGYQIGCDIKDSGQSGFVSGIFPICVVLVTDMMRRKIKTYEYEMYQDVGIGVPKAFFTAGITIKHFSSSFHWFHGVKGWVRRD
jgi:hypothetical protein